jgi:hypothetical protein
MDLPSQPVLYRNFVPRLTTRTMPRDRQNDHRVRVCAHFQRLPDVTHLTPRRPPRLDPLALWFPGLVCARRETRGGAVRTQLRLQTLILNDQSVALSTITT